MRTISRSEGVDQREPAVVTIGPAICGEGNHTHSSPRFHRNTSNSADDDYRP